MDRERFGSGGRKASPKRRNVRRQGEEADANAGSAGGFGVAAMAPPGRASHRAVPGFRGVRPCRAGCGAGQRTGPVAEIESPDQGDAPCRNPAFKLPPCTPVRAHGSGKSVQSRAGRKPSSGQAKRQMPVGCGHHRANFGSVRGLRHSILPSVRHKPRAALRFRRLSFNLRRCGARSTFAVGQPRFIRHNAAGWQHLGQIGAEEALPDLDHDGSRVTGWSAPILAPPVRGSRIDDSVSTHRLIAAEPAAPCPEPQATSCPTAMMLLTIRVTTIA